MAGYVIQPGQLVAQRYICLQPINRGGMGEVYRMLDRLNGQEVALKLLTVQSKALHFTSQNTHARTDDLNLSLALEFRILASLRHPNIISVLDYGFYDDGKPFYTMELVNGSLNIRDYAACLSSVDDKVDLVLSVLQALIYLHQRDVIHRDIKPENILIDGTTVKLVDFGISLAPDYVRQSQQDRSGPAGTLYYMAPEVLKGDPASVASDLYAVGLILYELLLGAHPFSQDLHAMVYEIFSRVIDPGEIDLPPQQAQIIARLLAKDPAQRYPSARHLAGVMAHAFGRPPLSVTLQQTNDSILKAARMVGRQAELAQLEDAFASAASGTGSAWLIGGESGVGKSRLVEELRTRGLVSGALVLRGQSVSAGGSLYGLWRPVLRRLILDTLINYDEAALLKPLIPDIDDILRLPHPIGDAPQLPPNEAKARLCQLVVTLFARQTRPVLLIMEDLHWANESLEILDALTRHAPQLRLLVIGTYRNDERPALPELLPAMTRLRLDRLQHPHIVELSANIIGERGRATRFIDWLEQETEGNVFFIVETLRTLAEQLGDLEQIDTAQLPRGIRAEGVQRIVRQRLARVGASDHQLLEYAAVAGRQIDIDLLTALSRTLSPPPPPDHSIDAWLDACASASVLELYEQTWRFAHDKLREGILDAIPPQRRAQLHLHVAEAILARRGADDDAHTAALAHHFYHAGDLPRAYLYGKKTGMQAARDGISSEAIRYLSIALDALNQMEPTDEVRRAIIDVTLPLTRAKAFTMADDSRDLLARALDFAHDLQDPYRVGLVQGALGALNFMRGNMGDALRQLHEATTIGEQYGKDDVLLLPYNIIGRVKAVSGDYATSNDLLRKGIQLAEQFHDEELRLGSLAFYSVGLEVIGEIGAGEPLIAQCLEQSRQRREIDSARYASDLVIVGMGFTIALQPRRAREYLQQALDAATLIDSHQTRCIAAGGLAVVSLLLDQPDQALDYLHLSHQIAHSHNSMIHYVLYHSVGAEIERRRSNLATARAQANDLLELALRLRQTIGEAEVRLLLGRLDYMEGDYDSSAQHIRQALESHDRHAVRAMYANALMVDAERLLAIGDLPAAKARLDDAHARFLRLRMTEHLRLAGELYAILSAPGNP